MVDVSVAAQLQQWSFDKTVPDGTRSSASSPNLSHPESETLRIDTTAEGPTPNPDNKDAISLQERYLSSEEDLSPLEDGNSSASDMEDDDIVVYESDKECFEARKMSIARFDQAKSCDTAKRVSYVAVGRAKVVDLATTVSTPMREAPPKRTASLALPAAFDKLKLIDQPARRSLAPTLEHSRAASPTLGSESRRPSTGHANSARSSSLRVSDSSSFTDGSTRSSSPAISETSTRSARPASVAAHRPAPRSSLFVSSATVSTASQNRPFPPLTPLSPETPSFLSSDPYETSTTNAASPILKSSPHKRLRSISMKLSLAKIAIGPSTKKWDSRVNGRPNMPPTPATPFTPLTAQQPAPSSSNFFTSPKDRLRRNSKSSRPTSVRGPSPEMPPVPTMGRTQTMSSVPKLVPRGADEREPILELPDFPDDLDAPPTPDPVVGLKKKTVRKRKSLMDLL